ncbi:MAG: hypothetical protein NTY02_15520 [Acidobacteria bacterium]|nr:hypothetical protein [Acidobacteriota bacterium]
MRTSSNRRAGAAIVLFLASLAWPVLAGAQAATQAATPAASQAATDPGPQEREELAAKAAQLAKQTQNPVSSLISVPFQMNWDMGIGDRQATGALLNFQPVVPFGISQSTNVILRVIMPLASQPTNDGQRLNGVGDIVMTAFFSPSKSGRIIWGVGPVLLLPTATNNALGTEKFGVGPSVVVLTQPGHWTIGMLFNQIWSVSGALDRKDVNQTFLQPFLNYNLGKGLAVGAMVEASGNWEADHTWTVPLLFTVSKVAMLGKRPVNFQVAAGPMMIAPDAGANWRFRFAAVFMFPR